MKDVPKNKIKKGDPIEKNGNLQYIDAKFYETSLISKIGYISSSRDCIDIAVKIAFILKDKSSIESIQELSNQENLNSVLKGTGNNGTTTKELQSSDSNKRTEALE